MNIYEKLLNIQNELKVPKGQYNSFGKYKFRSCEDILEAVKPICFKYKATLKLSDEIKRDGDRYYVEATALLTDVEEEKAVSSKASSREEETKKGMDSSQITGTASSYARKYALNGLFCIDDTKDADTDEFAKQNNQNKTDEFAKQNNQNKNEENEIIDARMADALDRAIANNNINETTVLSVLMKYGYKSTSEIQKKNHMAIVNELKGEKNG